MTTVAEERVLVLPGVQPGQLLRSVPLPEPRSGRQQGFIVAAGSQLLEVNRFKQEHSAWLTGGRLLADGGVFLATPYDPLFLMLPLLDAARDKDEACPAGKFKELDELLSSGLQALAEHVRACAPEQPTSSSGGAPAAAAGRAAGAATAPAAAAAAAAPAAVADAVAEVDAKAEGAAAASQDGAGASAAAAAAPQMGGSPREAPPPTAAACAPLSALARQLACVCDVKTVDDTSYYRLNDQRVLAWLVCKYKRLQATMAAQVAGMDGPHAVAYVLGFLGEYVGERWMAALAKHLGHDAAALSSGQATGALQPADANAQAASRPAPPGGASGPPEKKQKVDPAAARAAAKQAALAKQAVGSKKLTAFFSKKS